MRNALIIGATVLSLSAGVPAFAQGGGDYCPKVPKEQMIPVETVQKKVQEMGYEVRRTRFDDGCYKVYITDKASGGEVEAYYNPATGELVRAKPGR